MLANRTLYNESQARLTRSG